MTEGYNKCKALVLREVKYKEADRLLTLYSADEGKITVKAPGALRKTSKFGAATQQLTYSDFTLLQRNGRLSITEASLIEDFKGLRYDLPNFSLGCYFAESAEAVLIEDKGEPKVMQMILNSLYALSNNLYKPELIKAVFELRFMCLLGYEPDVHSCVVCGDLNPQFPTFGISTGHICCRSCRNSDVGNTDCLCKDSLCAMRYIISSNPKSIFSFNISDEALYRLGRVTEDYFKENSDRKYPTLEYWKKIKL